MADDIMSQPFDYRRHGEEFTRYCEVVILKDGTVEYAVPSHQEKLKALCRERGVDPIADCPRSMYARYDEWLMQQTGAVCVWYDRWLGNPNDAQARSLRRLQMHGCCSFDNIRGLRRPA